MSAVTITQRVLEKFTNGDFSGSQGLWFGQIPSDKDLPFVAFAHGGETPEYTAEREYLDKGTFTFSVYAEGIAETERLALIVMSVYDAFVNNWNGLDFAGGTCVEWARTRYMISIEPIEDVNALIVGKADIQYAYTVQKTLP